MSAFVAISKEFLENSTAMRAVIDAGFFLTNRRDDDLHNLAWFDLKGPMVEKDGEYLLMVDGRTLAVWAEKVQPPPPLPENIRKQLESFFKK